MKSIKRIAILFLVLALTVALLASCSSDEDIPDGYHDITCNGEYFRLFVPKQWNSNSQSGISSAFYSMSENSCVSMTRSRAVHKVTDTTEDENDTVEAREETIAEFWDDYSASFSDSLDGYAFVQDVKTTLGGQAAAKYKYTFLNGTTAYTYQQIIAKYKGYFYIFTYSAPTEYFDSHESEVDDISSFVIFLDYPFEADSSRAANNGADAPEGMKLVSDERVAYRFYAPTAWTVDSNVGQSSVYFSETDHSNVSAIAYMPVTETMTPSEYWDICSKDYEYSFKNFELISKTEPDELSVDGKRAMRYVFTATNGGVDYKIDQTVIQSGSMIYIITYTAVPENFDLHTTDVQAMIDAFEFR